MDTDIVIIALIPMALQSIMLYIAFKAIYSRVKHSAFDMIDELIAAKKGDLEKWLNSKEGQATIYSIGGILGAGIKDQMKGLIGGGGGKGLQGIIGNLVSGWINRQQGNPSPPQDSNIGMT